ncbi:hypothetical protein RDI58_014837 [Solanum bulbocastanum]|uniref:Uncharacterized protein n=1 Tax=Solanum bulbocastanum TaxID=147425 RepID=A0AAN8YBE0_SOLBU
METMVTPASGVQHTLSPLTFGSYLPGQFRSIQEEEEQEDENEDECLPVGFWSVEALSKVVIGKPLYTDKYNADMNCISYARVLVEEETQQGQEEGEFNASPRRKRMGRRRRKIVQEWQIRPGGVEPPLVGSTKDHENIEEPEDPNIEEAPI